MDIIYSDMSLPSLSGRSSIFLAGPTPRDEETVSWRPEAIQGLSELNYNGFVFYPEWSDFSRSIDYISQVNWERFGLLNSTAILVWVPRNLENMPAFTTNVEFGRYVTSGRLLYGRPDDSHNNRYLDWLYKEDTGRNHHNDLQELLKEVVSFCSYSSNGRAGDSKSPGVGSIPSASMLREAHKYCSNNKLILEEVRYCVCFYCFKKFKYENIETWVGRERPSAMCPHCGVDSVLPDNSMFYNLEFLEKMHEYYFSPIKHRIE